MMYAYKNNTGGDKQKNILKKFTICFYLKNARCHRQYIFTGNPVAYHVAGLPVL